MFTLAHRSHQASFWGLTPGLDLLRQDPSQSLEASCGALQEGLHAHVPSGLHGRAGGTSLDAPLEPWHCMAGAPEPLPATPHCSRYLSVRISSELDVLLHPKMHVSLKCGQQTPATQSSPASLPHGPAPRRLASFSATRSTFQGPQLLLHSHWGTDVQITLVSTALRFSNCHVLALP